MQNGRRVHLLPFWVDKCNTLCTMSTPAEVLRGALRRGCLVWARGLAGALVL